MEIQLCSEDVSGETVISTRSFLPQGTGGVLCSRQLFPLTQSQSKHGAAASSFQDVILNFQHNLFQNSSCQIAMGDFLKIVKNFHGNVRKSMFVVLEESWV